MKKTLASLAILLVSAVSLFGCRKELIAAPETALSQLDSKSAASATITKYVEVNLFSGSNALNDGKWNNWNSSASLTAPALKYNNGSASSVKATLSAQSGVSDNGASYSPTMAPKEVIRYASYATTNRKLTISGLDNNKRYDLELYASRSGVSNNTTRFGIGSKTVEVKTDNNLANKAVFTGLAPASGQILVNIEKVNTFNYLNGFRLIEKSSGAGDTEVPQTADKPATPTAPGCNSNQGRVFTLQPTSGSEIYLPDASSRGWKGGDTLRIPAGNYSLIDLGKFNGDSCRPIVITNYGGKVNVAQIRLGNTSYIKLLGNGHSGTNYGFYISSNRNAGVAITLAHHVEVANVEVTGTEVGLYFKKNPVSSESASIYPNYVMSNFYIHHNYIHNVRGEGMYIGHTYPSSDPYNNNLIPIRLDRVEIAYNTVDGTDWDGIQLSNARSGAKIHHNTVLNFGRINKGSQQAGIILGGNTNGDIYDNVVKNGTGNGIQAFGYGTIRIYNNQVENAGNDGTASGQEAVFCNDHVNNVENNPKQQILFYNNTIKNPRPKGAIRVAAYNNNSNTAQITDNTFYIPSAPTNWMNTYVISNIAGSTISGNKLVK